MKYILTLPILSFVLFHTSPFAQDEEPASNSDLRGGRVLFSIDHQDSNYTLLRSSAGAHSLVTDIKGVNKTEKMDSRSAMQLDDEVSAEFINLKYFMGEVESCQKFKLVSMRGEQLKLCPKDKRRLVKVADLIKLIESKR